MKNNKKQQVTTIVEPQIESLSVWLNPDSETITKTQLFEWLKTQTKLKQQEDLKLYVGTDSNIMGLRFRFISVVCLYTVGKGGNYFYSVNWKPREQYRGNQQARMFEEATISIDLATQIQEELGLKSEIHIDASPKEAKQFTSGFSDNLKSYVVSSGFDCKLKPDSIAAFTIADKHTR